MTLPFAQAAVEYGVLAGRGGISQVASDLFDAVSSPTPETLAWVAAGLAVVLLATRRRGAWTWAFGLLLVAAAVLAAKAFDLV